MPVYLTIKSAKAADNAFDVATDKERRKLANFIIWTGEIPSILNLLDHSPWGNMMTRIEFSNRQLKRMVKTVQTRGTLSQVMDCLTNLLADEEYAELRAPLFDRLMRGPIKFWLKGKGVEFNVHPAFRRTKFLPAEIELMIAKVKRSRNHEYVDALAKFRDGMLSNAQWEDLQLTAIHFHGLKADREEKKKTAA